MSWCKCNWTRGAREGWGAQGSEGEGRDAQQEASNTEKGMLAKSITSFRGQCSVAESLGVRPFHFNDLENAQQLGRRRIRLQSISA